MQWKMHASLCSQDTGSTSTILRMSVVKSLGLQGDIEKVSIGCINAVRKMIECSVNVRIKGIEKQESFDLHEVQCMAKYIAIASSLLHDIDLMRYPHLNNTACTHIDHERCDMPKAQTIFMSWNIWIF